MSSKGGFMQVFEYKIMPVVYGLGAAVVIIGALFKIQHWPFANALLIVGLGTEALIFALSSFLPIHKDPDWARVYPQLSEDYDAYYLEDNYSGEDATAGSTVKQLDDMFQTAGIDQDAINRLSKGFSSLSESVVKLADVGDAAAASNDYASNLKQASGSLTEMSKSYAATAAAMSGMSSAATDAAEYHTQVQTITKNLGSLNAVYEMELQDANNHLKAMNKFYSNLSSAMDSMAEASKDTEQFKNELHKLTSNLTSLNNVYGNMLTAMKG